MNCLHVTKLQSSKGHNSKILPARVIGLPIYVLSKKSNSNEFNQYIGRFYDFIIVQLSACKHLDFLHTSWTKSPILLNSNSFHNIQRAPGTDLSFLSSLMLDSFFPILLGVIA